MFHKAASPAPVVEPAPDVVLPADLVPLSHLELDLPAPTLGWPAYLSSRDIAVVNDDIGRAAIARSDARLLISEHHADETRQAEMRAAAEQRAVHADQKWRASFGQGVEVPAGMTYAEAVRSAELDAQSYRPRRRSLVEDLLSNDGITFHPIRHEADEAS